MVSKVVSGESGERMKMKILYKRERTHAAGLDRH